MDRLSDDGVEFDIDAYEPPVSTERPVQRSRRRRRARFEATAQELRSCAVEIELVGARHQVIRDRCQVVGCDSFGDWTIGRGAGPRAACPAHAARFEAGEILALKPIALCGHPDCMPWPARYLDAQGLDRCRRHAGPDARPLRRGPEDGSDRSWYRPRAQAGGMAITKHALAKARTGYGAPLALEYGAPGVGGLTQVGTLDYDGTGPDDVRLAVGHLAGRLDALGIPVELWATQRGVHAYVTATARYDRDAIKAWLLDLVADCPGAGHWDVCSPALRARATPGTRLVDRDLEPVHVARVDDVAWHRERLLSGAGRVDLGPYLGTVGAPGQASTEPIRARGRRVRGRSVPGASADGLATIAPLPPVVPLDALVAHVDAIEAGSIETGSVGVFTAGGHLAKRYVLSRGLDRDQYARVCQDWAWRCTKDAAQRVQLAASALEHYEYWAREREARAGRQARATRCPARVQTPLRLADAAELVAGVIHDALEQVGEAGARKHCRAWMAAAFVTLHDDGVLDRQHVTARYVGQKQVRIAGRRLSIGTWCLDRLKELGVIRRACVAAPILKRPEIWFLDYARWDALRAGAGLPAVVVPVVAQAVVHRQVRLLDVTPARVVREYLEPAVCRILIAAAGERGAAVARVLDEFRARAVITERELDGLEDLLPLYRARYNVGLDFSALRRIRRQLRQSAADPAAIVTS